jgi:hypothetical protein
VSGWPTWELIARPLNPDLGVANGSTAVVAMLIFKKPKIPRSLWARGSVISNGGFFNPRDSLPLHS